MYHSWGDWQGNLLAEGFYTNISDVFALTEIGKDENGVIINERGNERGSGVWLYAGGQAGMAKRMAVAGGIYRTAGPV